MFCVFRGNVGIDPYEGNGSFDYALRASRRMTEVGRGSRPLRGGDAGAVFWTVGDAGPYKGDREIATPACALVRNDNGGK